MLTLFCLQFEELANFVLINNARKGNNLASTIKKERARQFATPCWIDGIGQSLRHIITIGIAQSRYLKAIKRLGQTIPRRFRCDGEQPEVFLLLAETSKQREVFFAVRAITRPQGNQPRLTLSNRIN